MLSNEKGQSLIEVLVVGVISAMMIIALIMIILNSLKNAQFAQNQTQATNLAQDTIDKIRILRDNNAYNTLTPSANTCFIGLWNTSGDFYCGVYNPNPDNTPFCYYELINGAILNYLGKTGNMPPATNISIPGSAFTREIKISQPTAYEADVTVTINWSDSSGNHSSILETIITKPNYDCVQ